MRIAILADPLDNQSAGVHVYTKGMVEALIRNNTGHEIILVREKVDPDLKGVKQIAVPNIRLPIGFASLRLFFIIPFVLWWKKVDVVVEPAHFGPFNLLARVKRVTIIHDLTPLLFPHLHRWHSQILQRIFLKGILKRTDVIVANSDHTVMDIRNMFPQAAEKVIRIYPGIRNDYGNAPGYDVLERYGIGKPYFLFVGTIEPRKDLNTLLNAFAIFHQMHPAKAMLVIAGGTGWKSESFMQHLETHPAKEHIVLTGYVKTEELPELYRNAVAAVYPSVYEGFGFPVAEALQFGTPVITSRNSGITEAGGKEAQYFDTGDARMLAEIMDQVSENQTFKAKAIANGPVHAAKFNWDEFAIRFLNKCSH